MLYWTLKFPENLANLNINKLFINTLYLIFLTSLVLLLFSFISNYGNRISRSKLLNSFSTFSITGYNTRDNSCSSFYYIHFMAGSIILNHFNFVGIKKIFVGSILGLVVVYFIRFYSLAFNGIKTGYEKINRSIDESSYLLGYSKLKTFFEIHLPYLKNSIFLIGILITIEVIKELPITLILRPFNFETFATTAYIFASQDLLEAAAAPALFLILIASAFILITSRYILRD